jgi:hypothetical protein
MDSMETVSLTDRGFLLRDAGACVKVAFATPAIVRVRKFAGDTEPVSHLIRYGFFRDDWPPVGVQVDEQGDTVLAHSEIMTVAVERPTGRLTVSDGAGGELLADHDPARVDSGGFQAGFVLPEKRRFFGLGDQTRERIEHRGTRGDLWVRNVSSYVPIPLLLTNDGLLRGGSVRVRVRRREPGLLRPLWSIASGDSRPLHGGHRQALSAPEVGAGPVVHLPDAGRCA